ncbi:MAG TPA: hypothetical protein VGL93_11165 [Streptosporangiaceae bacterium]
MAVLGFVVPWLMVAAAVVAILVPVRSTVDGTQLVGIEIGLFLLVLTGVFDLVWTVVGFAVKRLGVSSFGYGVFIAFLTQLIAGALGTVVLFGICVSSLNDL